jgi:exodeoxyribonuclease-3
MTFDRHHPVGRHVADSDVATVAVEDDESLGRTILLRGLGCESVCTGPVVGEMNGDLAAQDDVQIGTTSPFERQCHVFGELQLHLSRRHFRRSERFVDLPDKVRCYNFRCHFGMPFGRRELQLGIIYFCYLFVNDSATRYTKIMKLYSWNVNGIRSVINKGAFQAFIKEHQPDILCLQETKAQQGQAEIDLPEYTEYWNSAKKPGYSGTAIFTKVKPISVLNGFADAIAEKYDLIDGYGDPTEEGRVISAEFDNFWVVTVYTPNAKRDLSRLTLRHNKWDAAFLEHLQELEKTKPVLACGDFNVAHKEIDLARPNDNLKNAGFTPEEREGMDNIVSAGFVDTFRAFHPDQTDAYTWWTQWGGARARNVGWRIDYWLVSESIKAEVTSAAIHADQMGSDHCPVSIELK